jgi:hypothetical protein
MTYRQASYAILESLKKTGDDSDVSIPLVLFYISVVANNIVGRDLRMGRRSGNHLAIFTGVPVEIDETGYYGLDLPAEVINIDFDGGVEFLSYNVESCCCLGPAYAQVSADPVQFGQLRAVYGDPMERPDASSPLYAVVGKRVNDREGYRIYIIGPECINLRDVQIGVYCPVSPDPCDLDEKIPVKVTDEAELIREVASLIRWVQLVPDNNVNDGADNQSVIERNVPQPQNQPQQETEQ